jgi:hypothetical protein
MNVDGIDRNIKARNIGINSLLTFFLTKLNRFPYDLKKSPDKTKYNGILKIINDSNAEPAVLPKA